MNRSLDNICFRVKRGEKYEVICFSDLTKEEQEYVLEKQDKRFLKVICKVLAHKLKKIGDTFDIVGGEIDE